MAVGFSNTNKPINPRGNDASPKAFNRAKLYSGKALDFDGVNDTINEQTISVSSASFSVSFYAKADNYASPLCALSIGTSGTFDLVFYPYDDFIGDGVRIYDAQISSNLLYGVTAELGVYNMFTLQCDGEYLEVYINGQFAKKEARTYSSTYTAIKIGSILGGTQYYNGQIAGFKIFNTALTAAQVADLYNNPEKVVPTGVDNTALKLWLPMQEGAGTTAYDGSGNGNHGTISGATYTHGIGAPVSQTAVIDWNKGTNILDYSIWNNSYWTIVGGILTDGLEAPDGTNTAFKFERDNASSGAIYNSSVPGLDQNKYRYVYAKLPSGSASASAQLLSHNTNTNNTFTITDEWQRFEVDSSPLIPANFYIVDFRAGVGVDEIHLWAPQATATNNPSVFVPTIGTAQSSEVLLPQGLTTGRDITGVNLFENVRKQGALNLDGNSWAEVHDNESLDITDAITLETWVYWDGSLDNGIMGKWDYNQNKASYLLYKPSATRFIIYVSSNGSTLASETNDTDISSGWNHLVGVYDGANLKCYLNGVVDGSSAYSSGLYSSDAVVEIGRYDEGSSTSYTNQLAQPRIYNRALTAEEVARNYNNAKSIYTNS